MVRILDTWMRSEILKEWALKVVWMCAPVWGSMKFSESPVHFLFFCGAYGLLFTYYNVESMASCQQARFYTTRDEVLNALATAICLSLFYLGPVIGYSITIILFWFGYYQLLLAYFIWMRIDRDTPHKDGRRKDWVCNSWIYRRFREYFPHILVKTVDIPPDQNYLFCLFPHGVMVTAAFAHFLTNAEGSPFRKLFPGLKSSLHTLNSNFNYPFTREYSLFCGLLSVSKEALLHSLNKKTKGFACVIAPGGSAEATVSQPGTQRVILKDRKGFIKLAIETGTSLVPMYAFGETDLFDHMIFPKDSLVYKMQEQFRKQLGFAFVVPFINGGGFFQNRWGFLPRPLRVTTVVGKPITVEKIVSPTKEDVDKLHLKFIDELQKLFEEHKHKYLNNADNVHLSIEGM